MVRDLSRVVGEEVEEAGSEGDVVEGVEVVGAEGVMDVVAVAVVGAEAGDVDGAGRSTACDRGPFLDYHPRHVELGSAHIRHVQRKR